MAYPKWEFDQGSAYQLSIGVLQAADILATAERDTEGPFEMAYETTGVGGWDDILVFEHQSGALRATHYQVKDQSANFEYADGEKTLKQYFADASQILEEEDPYGGDGSLPAEERHFLLGFPSLTIGLKRTGSKSVLLTF